ncbi:MAG: SIR2 family protein [Novosphingobium sp.]|nr:SIR2 family protein [Novosphingobium sp.]
METTLATDTGALIGQIAAKLQDGTAVPYLGPGISGLFTPPAPMSPEALADFLGGKVTLPARARGNAWAAAQYIESYRHRETVTALMNEAFAVPVEPSPFHRWLAGLGLPLIVDSWYAGEMRRALAESGEDWAEIQGISRAQIGEFCWFRCYDAAGAPAAIETAIKAKTLLYAPHGAAAPAGNYLISDADYVEVLTEIDIQTPIPEEVRRRRTGMSFVFFGCHFHDQLLRTYARQVMKRSSDTHYAVVELDRLTNNEKRFLDEQRIIPVDMPLGGAIEALVR